MSEAVLREHLKQASQKAKAYTNAENIKYNEAVVAALEEMAALKADKITSPVNNNIVAMNENGNLKDSGLSVMTVAQMRTMITNTFGSY